MRAVLDLDPFAAPARAIAAIAPLGDDPFKPHGYVLLRCALGRSGNSKACWRTKLQGRNMRAALGACVVRRPRQPGGQKKCADNPMDQETRARNLSQAPRCGAKTRAGTTCRRPAIHGRKRCRLHGGLSPGAPRGFRNGNFKNGNWTAEAVAERLWLRSLVQSFAKVGTTA